MRFADNRSKPFAGGDRLQMTYLHMQGKFCVNQSHSNGVVWTKKVAYGLRNICCVFAA